MKREIRALTVMNNIQSTCVPPITSTAAPAAPDGILFILLSKCLKILQLISNGRRGSQGVTNK